MKKIIPSLIFLALLQGCGGTSPKLSNEELKSRATSNLNIYDDNRVGIKYEHFTYWGRDKNFVLGIEANGEVYNAKDVDNFVVAATSRKRNNPDISLKLRSGKEIKTSNNKFGWRICDAKNKCSERIALDGTGRYKNKFFPGFVSMSNTDLAGKHLPRPDTILISDDRATPSIYFLGRGFKVEFLRDEQITRLDERWMAVQKSWDDGAAEREINYRKNETKPNQQNQQVRESSNSGDPFTGRSYKAKPGTALYEQFYGNRNNQ